jgi:hypothetical protein
MIENDSSDSDIMIVEDQCTDKHIENKHTGSQHVHKQTSPKRRMKFTSVSNFVSINAKIKKKIL